MSFKVKKTFEKSKTCIDMEKIFNLLTTGERTIQELSDICNLNPTRVNLLFKLIEARKNVVIEKTKTRLTPKKYSIVRK